MASKNAAGLGADSALLTKKTDASTDRITITSAKWKTGDFRIVGTGSQVGATVQAYRVNADGSAGAAIAGASARRRRRGSSGNRRLQHPAAHERAHHEPGPDHREVERRGQAGPFTVSNG